MMNKVCWTPQVHNGCSASTNKRRVLKHNNEADWWRDTMVLDKRTYGTRGGHKSPRQLPGVSQTFTVI